jgi:MSHA pilin protein MshC
VNAMPARVSGFTLVELVGVIAIAGILAAVAAPRFFDTATFSSRGYFDSAAGFLRYAQKMSIARHGGVNVLIDSTGLTLCSVTTTPCPEASQLPGPDGSQPFEVVVPDGVSQTGSAASISFDAQGRPNSGLVLNITGDRTRTLTVETETGYVY